MIGLWDLSDLQRQFGGEITAGGGFKAVSTDTRKIAAGDLFVALQGPNFDAHDFVAQAVEKGAVAAVVSRKLDLDIPQWIVADTRIALGQIALANRQRFQGDVYAVTGSSGKTTVKEMLNAILSQQHQVLATWGNLNNDIGVPLTLFELNAAHQVAVIEQGASAIGEIAYTTALSLPDVAILNNAMGAHLEGFGSLQGVVQAKGEIFSTLQDNGGTAIINKDDPNAGYWLKQTENVKRKLFSVTDPDADIFADQITAGGNGCYRFQLHLDGEQQPVQLAVMGRHNVSNALAAAAAVSVKGVKLPEIVSGLEAFTAVGGRMRPLHTKRGALLIDDSYNANRGSVNAASALLADLDRESVLVLGDMAELGQEAATEHYQVGCRAAQKGVGHLWVTGVLSRHSVQGYLENGGADGRHFADKAELIAALEKEHTPEMAILVKGSRSAAMDQVVVHLADEE